MTTNLDFGVFATMTGQPDIQINNIVEAVDSSLSEPLVINPAGTAHTITTLEYQRHVAFIFTGGTPTGDITVTVPTTNKTFVVVNDTAVGINWGSQVILAGASRLLIQSSLGLFGLP